MAAALRPSLYRPFTKNWLYFDRFFNNRVYQQPQLFPDAKSENRVILTNANFGGTGSIAIMTDVTPDLHSNGDAQSFPLYLCDNPESDRVAAVPQLDLGSLSSAEAGIRRDAITDAALKHFQAAYPDEQLSKEDLFYYIYGLLHSREYLARYADNLSKELPRIPRVRSAKDFWVFSKAGRHLAELHVNYEQVQPYPAKIESTGKLTGAAYRVTAMKHGKLGKEKDRTTVVYNERITVKGIPLEAYDYVINGRSAIDWVMERQAVWTDKASGIVHDANDYAIETAKNPKYPLDLLLRVVTVSLETLRIVGALPALDLLET
jgi:predicted helicase